MELLSDRLYSIRKAAGYSRTGLDRAAALSLGSVAKYELGDARPEWGTVTKLAQALEVAPDMLLGKIPLDLSVVKHSPDRKAPGRKPQEKFEGPTSEEPIPTAAEVAQETLAPPIPAVDPGAAAVEAPQKPAPALPGAPLEPTPAPEKAPRGVPPAASSKQICRNIVRRHTLDGIQEKTFAGAEALAAAIKYYDAQRRLPFERLELTVEITRVMR